MLIITQSFDQKASPRISMNDILYARSINSPSPSVIRFSLRHFVVAQTVRQRRGVGPYFDFMTSTFARATRHPQLRPSPESHEVNVHPASMCVQKMSFAALASSHLGASTLLTMTCIHTYTRTDILSFINSDTNDVFKSQSTMKKGQKG